MDDSLIERIREYASSRGRGLPFATASVDAIDKAEQELGFSIPAVLRSCYLTVGNGGFGPAYGIIGVEGGYASDYGNLVETYKVLKNGHESDGNKWKRELLPFCEWGCNLFSCVGCADDRNRVYIFEEGAVRPQGCTLVEFFELWMNDTDILSSDPVKTEDVEIVNPFTKERHTISRRRRGE